MSTQTIQLPPPTAVNDNFIQWTGLSVEIFSILRDDPDEGCFLETLRLPKSTAPILLWTRSTMDGPSGFSGPDLSDSFEKCSTAITIIQGENSVTFGGPNVADNLSTDSEETYDWRVSSSKETELNSFVNSADDTQPFTLIIDDCVEVIYSDVSVLIENTIPEASIVVDSYETVAISETYQPNNFIRQVDSGIVSYRWAGSILISGRFFTSGIAAYLRSIIIFDVTNGTIQLYFSEEETGSFTTEGPELLTSWEKDIQAVTFTAAPQEGAAETLPISGPDNINSLSRDDMEPYSWSPSNGADLAAFFELHYEESLIAVSFRAAVEDIYSDVTVSIETPLPTANIAVTTYSPVYRDISIDIETPIPTIGTRGNSYDPYKNVAISIETPLPEIQTAAVSRFLPGSRELYVCDSNGSQLWHFTDPDDITTGSLVGSFPASMGTPSAMAQDNAGVAYVLASKVVWRIPDLTNPAGAEEIGSLSLAGTETVTCMAFDSQDRLFFVERNFRTVYHIDIHTALDVGETLASRRVNIDRLPSSFNRVDGLSFSSQNVMYMAENGSNTIGYLTDLTDATTAIEVSPSFTNVNGPITIALDDDDILYVSDNPTDKLWKLEDLTDPSTAVEVGEYPDDLQSPTGSIIVTTTVDLDDVVYRDVAVSIETPLPTIGISLGTYVASFNDVAISIETPLPTINMLPDKFDVVFHNIAQ